MWNIPKPAPECQLGWSDKRAARAALKNILLWEFDKIILAHGDLIETDGRLVVKTAWRSLLADGPVVG